MGSRIRAFDWYCPRWSWMTLNDLGRLNSLYFAFFTEFNSFAGQLRHSGWRSTYSVRKYGLPVPVFHFWPKLTHPAARSLCDSWATCFLTRTHRYAKKAPELPRLLGVSTNSCWPVICRLLSVRLMAFPFLLNARQTIIGSVRSPTRVAYVAVTYVTSRHPYSHRQPQRKPLQCPLSAWCTCYR